jgi:hypothetical protein
MLRILKVADRTSREEDDRKLRLFAVACWRRVGDMLPDGRFHRLIEAQESFADGEIGEPTLAAALDEAAAVGGIPDPVWTEADARERTFWVARFGVHFDPESMAWATSDLAGHRAGSAVGISVSASEDSEVIRIARRSESRTQADLIREIFGDPLRPPEIDPAWLTWNGGTIPGLAQSIYQERAFDRMPILADALEEAGCAEATLLSHCRDGSGHVRGCWALDALLGRR